MQFSIQSQANIINQHLFMDFITQIKSSLYRHPQKCIAILSTHKFINNISNQQLSSLVQIIQQALQQFNKKNQKQSFKTGQTSDQQILNSQVIICIYSIIIMKSLKRASSQDHLIFNSKIAIEILLKLHKQSSDEIKKVISGILLKIPSFSNYKTIAKDIDPQFISVITMKKHAEKLRQQCPNIFEQKLQQNKHTQWAQFLSYKLFSLKNLCALLVKINEDQYLNNSHFLVDLRQKIKIQAEYLVQRANKLGNQPFQIHELCLQFQKMYSLQVSQAQSDIKRLKKNYNSDLIQQTSNALQLRLKILLQTKNYLLKILMNLIKKLKTFWFRKIKWLFDFINELIINFKVQQGLEKIENGQLWNLKKSQLKYTIEVIHTYYKIFGDGLFVQQKFKSLFFTGQFSFYKLVQALLYNEYDFVFVSDKNRIVNYQKAKKVTEQSKSKNNLVKTVNVNSKSLNINLHYDIVFQKMILAISLSEGDAYPYVGQLINICLKLYLTYYQKSQTYFYGGNLLSMIQNCKNSNILKQNSKILIQKIKNVLYPDKKMIKQGLQYFCQQVFYNYMSVNKQKLKKVKNSDNFVICQNEFVHIIGSQKESFEQNKFQLDRQSQKLIRGDISCNKVIRKTKSYDMILQGWSTKENKQTGGSHKNKYFKDRQKKDFTQSQIFYSIKEQKRPSNQNNKQPEVQQNSSILEDQMILTPKF